MTLSHAILRDLISGQSTAGALADRLRITPDHATGLLQRHETDGLVTTTHIRIGTTDALKVYRLTALAHQNLTDRESSARPSAPANQPTKYTKP